LFLLCVIAADDRAAITDYHRTLRRERINDGNHAHARRIWETFLQAVARRAMCRDSSGGVIEHRQRRRSLAFTRNDLQEQYFVI
jgi:hypothetical protein